MRFRQLISPMYKNLYDVCLNQAPFYQNEVIEGMLDLMNYIDRTIQKKVPYNLL
jgi:hypothetical protein